ncbi:MAG: response regulator transcription factor [Flavisolibacter sp.]|nr:response regulator transcription factor [Flavisolibacter sp.]
MSTILLLEDDLKLASEVKSFLQRNEYNCAVVYDGLLFCQETAQRTYNLYILDINVPTLNGLEVCKRIRKVDKQTPILMLTAYGGVEDKVEALNIGADDYLVKPFHLDELLARIKALLRRSSEPQKTDKIYLIADLEINAREKKVNRAGKEISLTPKEYKLLELLAQEQGRTLSKQIIAKQVWGINFETGTNTIEVYISFLRNKIDKGFEVPLIHTRAGYGYFLKEIK